MSFISRSPQCFFDDKAPKAVCHENQWPAEHVSLWAAKELKNDRAVSGDARLICSTIEELCHMGIITIGRDSDAVSVIRQEVRRPIN